MSTLPDKRQHILLVEDTASLAQMYEQFLERQNYDVTSVFTAQDALSYLNKSETSLLLLDLKLPDMDGLDVMQELKSMDFQAPIIIITGHGSINTAVEAMRLGAWDFLVKPFNVDRLGDAVAKAIAHGRFEASDLSCQDETHMAAGINFDNFPASLPRRDSTDASKRKSRENEDNNANGKTSQIEDRSQKPDFGGFIGTSPVMQKLYGQLENAARSQAPVFITGLSGTGKEVCAEAIHKHSARADKPFIPINCAAIPRDLIESELFGHVKGAYTGAISDRDGAVKLADGGTLFLDEIGEMDVNMQTKLLRFLQNYTFQKVGGSRLERSDVRIICATNRDPQIEIRKGNFREDLYYRLYVIPIHMPPLNQRGDDIVDIAHALLKRYSKEENKSFQQFSQKAEENLLAHNWPGNIRELQNIVRNIVVMNDTDIVTVNMLPETLTKSHSHVSNISHENEDGLTGLAGMASQDNDGQGREPQAPQHQNIARTGVKPLWLTEKQAIEQAIEICGGNIPKAALLLEVSPSTIYRKKASWDEEDNQQDIAQN